MAFTSVFCFIRSFQESSPNPALPVFLRGPEEKHGGGADFIDGDLFSQVASNTPKKSAPEVIKETKIIRRAVKEIRIFYDDGTYESFVPSK